MNYNTYRFQESEHGYFFYFISPFDGQDLDLVSESIEHYISNVPTDMNKYLDTCNFDAVKIEKVNISPIDVINKTFQPDDKNMLTSNSFISLIPPPKQPRTKKEPKGEAKPKPAKEPKEKKEAKPRAKKSTQKVDINTDGAVLNMNN